MCMYALTPFVFIRGVIAPKWFARSTFLPQNGLHAQFFSPISLSQAIAPIQVGRSDLGISPHKLSLLFFTEVKGVFIKRHLYHRRNLQEVIGSTCTSTYRSDYSLGYLIGWDKLLIVKEVVLFFCLKRKRRQLSNYFEWLLKKLTLTVPPSELWTWNIWVFALAKSRFFHSHKFP